VKTTEGATCQAIQETISAIDAAKAALSARGARTGDTDTMACSCVVRGFDRRVRVRRSYARPMTPRPIKRLTRDVEAPLLLESFFIAAVGSFLGIRVFLALTGYPRIGSGGIHIAHMLWGGLLMLVALMLLLSFLDRSIHHVAAVIAGLGFGTFIDEIGKFITADNDYFYRPAIALIYGSFVVAFLVARVLVGQRRLRPDEALANALALLAGTPAAGIEPDDRTRIRGLLASADATSARARLINDYLDAVPGVPERKGRIESIRRRLADGYAALMGTRWAERALTIFVAGYALVAVVGVLLVAVSTPSVGATETSSVAAVVEVLSTIVGAVLVARGLLNLRASRMDAYRWFMRGLLVWLLITQVFVFYSSQLAGTGGLVADLLAYGSLRFALTREGTAGRLTSAQSRATP
jgi:hypothetical protein